MAPLPLTRGCYCSVSLRTCTITLASIYLVYTLLEVAMAMLLEFYATTSPQSAIGDDYEDTSTSAEHLHEHEHSLRRRSDDEDDPHLESSFADEYRVVIIASAVFGIFSLVLGLLNIIFLVVLIVGAATRKASCIRPWLWVGAAACVNDVISFFVFVAMGVHYTFDIGPLLDTPLVVWLWVVAWSFYEDCRSAEERRNAAAPASVAMAALLEDGDAKDAANDCSVAYSALC